MAAADAAWASAYPNFHPEHRDIGIAPHRVHGCYYFTRHFVDGDTVVDISGVIDRKVRAVTAHRTMMRTQLADQKERINMAGFSIPALSRISSDDYASYWDGLIRAAAALAAQETHLTAVERFRSSLLTQDDPLVKYLMSL
jgi:hypothetical protein